MEGFHTHKILRAVILVLLLAAGELFAQNSAVLSNQNGTVVGMLRDVAGAPAVGVRVSAMARPDTVTDLISASSFASLGETDSAGRYRLDNIPPGKYYIVAGRVDAPTYYPGTVQVSEGSVVAITPGLNVSGINFVLNNGSVGRATTGQAPGSTWVVPIRTQIEGGGKVPVFEAGLFPALRLLRNNGARIDVSLSDPSVTISESGNQSSVLAPLVYRVSVENLPDTYRVKSITFGVVDLATTDMQLLRVNASATSVTQSIDITLAAPTKPKSAGVRISGKISVDTKRSIYISGNPGAVYSDGTFEFVGVSPGQHNIVTFDNPSSYRSLGATFVVGVQDLLNIALEEISAAPAKSDQPAPPAPAVDLAPGSRIAAVAIHGRVLDETTREPFNAGKIVINGNYAFPFSLNDDGSFDIPRLLPGTYLLDAFVFGIGSVSRTVVLEQQDKSVELTLAP